MVDVCSSTSDPHFLRHYTERRFTYRHSQVGQRGPCPLKFIENFVVWCFERWCPKPNTVALLKSKSLAPPKIFDRLRYWFHRVRKAFAPDKTHRLDFIRRQLLVLMFLSMSMIEISTFSGSNFCMYERVFLP